jgi:uncharacterized membrane protein
MTDTPNLQIPPPPLAPRVPVRALQVALALSLALNLAVGGVVVGAMLNRDKLAQRGAITREMGFGPFTAAFAMEDRRALRNYLQQKAPQLRNANAQRRAEIANLQAALQADPFSPDALRAALGQMQGRQADQLALGHEAIAAVILSMPQDQRRALADRLAHTARPHGNMHPKGGHD